MDKNEILYVNDVQAAKILGLCTQTLANWRCNGLGPEYVKLSSRCIRYEYGALIKYMSKHKVTPFKEQRGFK